MSMRDTPFTHPCNVRERIRARWAQSSVKLSESANAPRKKSPEKDEPERRQEPQSLEVVQRLEALRRNMMNRRFDNKIRLRKQQEIVDQEEEISYIRQDNAYGKSTTMDSQQEHVSKRVSIEDVSNDAFMESLKGSDIGFLRELESNSGSEKVNNDKQGGSPVDENVSQTLYYIILPWYDCYRNIFLLMAESTGFEP